MLLSHSIYLLERDSVNEDIYKLDSMINSMDLKFARICDSFKLFDDIYLNAPKRLQWLDLNPMEYPTQYDNIKCNYYKCFDTRTLRVYTSSTIQMLSITIV